MRCPKNIALTVGAVGEDNFTLRSDLPFVALKGVHNEKEIVRNYRLYDNSMFVAGRASRHGRIF